mmetsp:Transcript_88649/g.286335  ORF Transcript_88649/g.286335 Transcript_88649/m.286335 type:complete len:88 (-) Transcript_88649:32-295(-)
MAQLAKEIPILERQKAAHAQQHLSDCSEHDLHRAETPAKQPHERLPVATQSVTMQPVTLEPLAVTPLAMRHARGSREGFASSRLRTF